MCMDIYINTFKNMYLNKYVNKYIDMQIYNICEFKSTSYI